MKKYIFTTIAVFFLFFFKFITFENGLSPDAMQMLGIFIGAVILWLFVGIDWPSVLVLFSLCLLPQAGTSSVMAASLGNTTISFLIFSFILTYALSETGFLKRCALFFINNDFARKSPWNFILMYLSAVFIIGSFIAPTVTFLIFYSLSGEIFASLKLKKGDAMAKAIMVGSAIMTSVSCAATPIAHTFPLMAMGYYEASSGISISYAEYLKVGLPAALLISLALFFILKAFYAKKIALAKTDIQGFELTAPGKITKKEIAALVVFLTVIIVWIVSGIFPAKFSAINKLGTSVPAMVGVVLLCLIQIDKSPVLDFKKAITEGVSWSSIMLCSATLAVGKFLTLSELGITSSFSALVAPFFGSIPPYVVLLSVIALTIVLTNLISNIVTTTVMYNIAYPLVTALAFSGTNVSPALTTILIGICASLAYATPPSIAHIAIAGASGWAEPSDMLKVGSVMAALSIAAVWLASFI